MLGRVEKRGRLVTADAAKALREMLSAVACCHKHGLVHADLKPDNFCYDADPDEPGAEARAERGRVAAAPRLGPGASADWVAAAPRLGPGESADGVAAAPRLGSG